MLAQTEGQEYKPDAVSHAWDRAKALEALNIEEQPFEMVDGNCQGYSQQRAIAISPLAVNPLKTTIHEMAHILCGHTAEGRVTDSETNAASPSRSGSGVRGFPSRFDYRTRQPK